MPSPGPFNFTYLSVITIPMPQSSMSQYYLIWCSRVILFPRPGLALVNSTSRGHQNPCQGAWLVSQRVNQGLLPKEGRRDTGKTQADWCPLEKLGGSKIFNVWVSHFNLPGVSHSINFILLLMSLNCIQWPLRKLVVRLSKYYQVAYIWYNSKEGKTNHIY